jgi:CRP-like cAMP-binding protein
VTAITRGGDVRPICFFSKRRKIKSALKAEVKPMLEKNVAEIQTLYGGGLSAERLFRAASPNIVKNLSRIKQEKSFPEKVSICAVGDTPRGIYILLHGKAQYSRDTETGGKNVLRQIEPNEIVGLTETLAEVPCEINAETVTPCVFEFIESGDLLRFLRRQPDVCFRLAQLLADNLQKSYRNLADL